MQFTVDVDAELTAWHEIQAESALRNSAEHHRCPPDMPPCPVCEELYDSEHLE